MLKLVAAATALVALSVVPAEARHHGRLTSWVSFQPQVRGMGCLRPQTRAMISQLTSRIGPIQITSTCGGRHAHNSQHYRGNAIDFRPVRASVGTTLAVLRSMSIVGGIGSYSGGLIHADVGERVAQWHGGGRRHAHRRYRYHRYAAYRG
jgi:uncharacterized protein YcbK (DUF882 family)